MLRLFDKWTGNGYRAAPAPQPGEDKGFDAFQIANALYRGLLRRAPDANGLRELIRSLESGAPLEGIIHAMMDSSECKGLMLREIMPPHTLPDLTALFPRYYRWEMAQNGSKVLVFDASEAGSFDLMESWIASYRYYDKPGVWGTKIDRDKQTMAAIIRGLGAKSCLEIGCFTGAVLSLLEQAGLDVAGVDASHLSFVFAYPNIRNHLRYGDLLSIDFNRRFDAIAALDIIEHLNPLKLDLYIDRLLSLLNDDGCLFLNSPMYGRDDVFGTLFEPYLAEWRTVGDASYWHDLDCDVQGWPRHGHLVWASPGWWEELFARKGLVRDRTVEAAIHAELGEFFEIFPARKSFFILRRAGAAVDTDAAVKRMKESLQEFAPKS
jgi:SAM-dependent methyltransferase